MRVVIALGGNAILMRGEAMTARTQRLNVNHAAKAIAQVVDAGHDVIITHGNGPQVGLLALQEMAFDSTFANPIDCLVAETQGMIGYLLAQELTNALGDTKRVVSIVTQVVVDTDDMAFKAPTKPIGPIYSKAQADRLASEFRWTIMADGAAYRRSVASPMPRHIIEMPIIRKLVDDDVIVICAGGGGVPVIRHDHDGLAGIDAVIDKDHTSGLLAYELQADALLLLTDVDGVYLDWGTPKQRRLTTVKPSDLTAQLFPSGSMGPKVQAAINFASTGKVMVGIGRLEDALAILEGRAGTIVRY